MTDWMMRGPEVSTCNCSYGCPCQFNALPTYGHCHAAIGMRIDQGHFGMVRLDGLKWAGVVQWPGALHEGHGIIQPVVDEKATPEQREAILNILSGQHSQPGTFFNIIASVVEKVLEPKFLPIEFEADPEKSTGYVRVPGVLDSKAEPIRNPVTGDLHQVKIVLREGFEFIEAEMASSTTRAWGELSLDWSGRHAHLANLHLNQDGLVR